MRREPYSLFPVLRGAGRGGGASGAPRRAPFDLPIDNATANRAPRLLHAHLAPLPNPCILSHPLFHLKEFSRLRPTAQRGKAAGRGHVRTLDDRRVVESLCRASACVA